MDFNQWLVPVDNLFGSTANYTSAISNSGASIGYLFVFFVGVIVLLFVLIQLKRGAWHFLR